MDNHTPSKTARERNLIEFAFTRWAFVAVILGLVAAGVVTFTSGVVLGVGISLRIAEEEAVAIEAIPDETISDELFTDGPEVEFIEVVEPNFANEVPSPVRKAIVESPKIYANSTSAGYTVQIGIYRDQEASAALYNQLWDEGYRPNIYSGQDSDGLPWYSVRVGSHDERREAEAEAEKLSSVLQVYAEVRRAGAP
jgi:hypothetical protein